MPASPPTSSPRSPRCCAPGTAAPPSTSPTTRSRVTVDRGLTWIHTATRATISQPSLVVVETKSAGAVSPMDRLLWSRGVRPTRISKYATGLAALDPALPHNRWSRTLRRHF